MASDPTADDAGDASPEENAGDVATEENAGDVEAEENGGDVATEENAVDVTEDDTGTVVDADGEAAAAANALQELDAHIDALQAQVCIANKYPSTGACAVGLRCVQRCPSEGAFTNGHIACACVLKRFPPLIQVVYIAVRTCSHGVTQKICSVTSVRLPTVLHNLCGENISRMRLCSHPVSGGVRYQVDDAVTTEDYELAAELEEQLSVLREQRDSGA